jgi:glycosyltransferase involved in cell wall biosynthesis
MSGLERLKEVFFERLLAGRRERRRWRGGIPDTKDVRVFYGRDHVPGREEIAQGGIVKCQDLSVLFPNVLQGANIVYLVSSALPAAVSTVVREARRAGAKVVVNQNGVAYPAWHGAGWERTNEPMKELLKSADYVFYQSAFCKRSADRYLGPCSGEWQILHNAVDTTTFVPGPELPLARGPVLLASGSHMQFYRVESVVRAFALFLKARPAARLLVAGHLGWRPNPREAEAELRNLCGGLGLREKVDIRGCYTQSEVVGVLQSAHLLVHTKYNDPCPRMVVEAMACGLPVVYSASGGTPELVGDSAGVGVPVPQGWEQMHSPDPELLAAAIETVVGRYGSFRASARERAAGMFDARSWIDRHRQVFASQLRSVA